jgi:hypothetical protein
LYIKRGPEKRNKEKKDKVREFQVIDPQSNPNIRRSMDQNDVVVWEELCNLVDEIDLPDTPTRISWQLEPKGTFSTVPLIEPIWKAKIPLKMKIEPTKIIF